MINFHITSRNPRHGGDSVGYLPHFFNESDPRPAKAQAHDNYAHGGGWNPFNGFELSKEIAENELTETYSIKYPGDPAYHELARGKLRNELIVVFPHAWVAIIQPDETFEISRMD